MFECGSKGYFPKEVHLSVSSAHTLAVWRRQNRIKRKDQQANRQLYSYSVTTIFSKHWIIHVFCGQCVHRNAAAAHKVSSAANIYTSSGVLVVRSRNNVVLWALAFTCLPSAGPSPHYNIYSNPQFLDNNTGQGIVQIFFFLT